MDINKAIEMAKEMGFDTAAPMDPKKLVFLTEVRDMCAACERGYGKSWACPPACGTLEEIEERARPYTAGLLVQTICRMDDEYDMEAWYTTGKLHGERFLELTFKFEAMEQILAMGTGGCRRCEECTYPDEPCRNPELIFPSMEGCGLLVSSVCKDNGVTYYYGPNTVAYTCCYLFNPEA